MSNLILFLINAAHIWAWLMVAYTALLLAIEVLLLHTFRKYGTDWIDDPELRKWAKSTYEKQNTQLVEPDLINITIEVYQKQLFAYDTLTGKFLLQAATKQDLMEKIYKHFDLRITDVRVKIKKLS
jgi:hypothetical protein